MADNILWSTIYLGNYPDIDPIEGDQSIHLPDNLLGTYGSAADPLFRHVVTIRTDALGTTINENDQPIQDGTLTFDLGSGSVTTTLDAFTPYSATVTYVDGSTAPATASIIQTVDGDVFLMNLDPDASWSTGQQIQSITFNFEFANSSGTIEQSLAEGNLFVACFAAGTLISTPGGAVPVEQLCRGMQVNTLDSGPQRLWQVHAQSYEECDLRMNDCLLPIVIPAGTLEPGAPARELCLSRQHRVLVGAGKEEVLVPAHALRELPGVTVGRPRDITYYHLLFARHHLILAEGAVCESLLAAEGALRALNGSNTLPPFDRFLLSARMKPVRPIEKGARAREIVRRQRELIPG